MNDHAEVCPLARRAMFQPVSITDKHSLSPQSFTRSTNSIPCGLPADFRRPYGLTLFRLNFRAGRTPPFRRRCLVHDGPSYGSHTLSLTVLVQACQHLWLVERYGVYQRFTYVGRTRSFLVPHRPCAGSFRRSSRFGVPINSVVTLSPELHTKSLPTSHVWVGNSWWSNWFHQFGLPPVKQKFKRLASRT